MKSRRFLPFLALMPFVCASCGSYYEVEALYASTDLTLIPQIGFTETFELPLTSVRTVAPSYDGYWVEWLDDIQLDQFRVGGNLVGKEISKISIDPEDNHTVTITLTGDCTAAYQADRFGYIAVDRSAFTIKNPDYDAVTAFLCMVVTGPTSGMVERDWNLKP